jgi:hypothetical protein
MPVLPLGLVVEVVRDAVDELRSMEAPPGLVIEQGHEEVAGERRSDALEHESEDHVVGLNGGDTDRTCVPAAHSR